MQVQKYKEFGKYAKKKGKTYEVLENKPEYGLRLFPSRNIIFLLI